MLQPIAENCVIHGYEGAAGEGVIEICASISGSALAVTVSDRGVGVKQVVPEGKSAQKTMQAVGEATGEAVHAEGEQTPIAPDTGLGLRNVRDMLTITYGPAAELSLFSREGGGATVRICLPLRTGGVS
jgi:sensor histidine kinase YesM